MVIIIDIIDWSWQSIAVSNHDPTGGPNNIIQMTACFLLFTRRKPPFVFGSCEAFGTQSPVIREIQNTQVEPAIALDLIALVL